MNSLLALVAVFAAVPQTPPPPPPREPAPIEAVSVTGTASVRTAPDRATFTAGVTTSAPTVAAAVEDNNRKMAAVIAALKREGATDGDLRTGWVSIFPEMDHQPGREPRTLGYRVNNNVTVTRGDVAGVSRLLQAAVDA